MSKKWETSCLADTRANTRCLVGPTYTFAAFFCYPPHALHNGELRNRLPDEKAQVFHKEARQLESSYAMLSVSLDEAIELWQLGHSGKSLQAVGVTSSLCKLLTQTQPVIRHRRMTSIAGE